MGEDKRLNEVIRVQKRPSSFVMMDKGFLEDETLSWKVKGILAYLLSKPDNWKVIVGDVVKHATDSKAAVYNGLAELSEHGYYDKIPVRNDSERRIDHWESTVYELPKATNPGNTPSPLLPGFQEIDNQDIDNLYIENRERNNNYINKKDFNNTKGRERKTPHPPALSVYGEFQRVQLASGQYDALVATSGHDKAVEYINRLDRHIASTGKQYASHYATIRKWIAEDERKANTADGRQAKPRQNRFCNFPQREWDVAQLEKLEQQHLADSLEKNNQQ